MSPAPTIPFICAWCDRVRTGAGLWRDIRLADLARVRATHGICPDCLARESAAARLEVR